MSNLVICLLPLTAAGECVGCNGIILERRRRPPNGDLGALARRRGSIMRIYPQSHRLSAVSNLTGGLDVDSFFSDSEEYSLERVLRDASMPDKTVILTTLNEAWAAPNSVVDLFLDSFRFGVDFSHEAYFMTPDYLKMMWRRIDFLRSVLEMGYNFVFTDADVMWFRDPFPYFHPNADFQIALFECLGVDVQNVNEGSCIFRFS
ncbi:uncharacterized protein at4g15970 [Phtheirospermum japonicum]|uniref:Uncharacterized protein at4g15970 n=1 Tax=Phtheirospermum japonicum TaxID=374723 RepID=A0A830C4F6_9LAMI|nr:uncharacterized protein at4g15970 [Phtheirospermum japonicum]